MVPCTSPLPIDTTRRGSSSHRNRIEVLTYFTVECDSARFGVSSDRAQCVQLRMCDLRIRGSLRQRSRWRQYLTCDRLRPYQVASSPWTSNGSKWHCPMRTTPPIVRLWRVHAVRGSQSGCGRVGAGQWVRGVALALRRRVATVQSPSRPKSTPRLLELAFAKCVQGARRRVSLSLVVEGNHPHGIGGGGSPNRRLSCG